MNKEKILRFQQALEELSTHILLSSPDEDGFIERCSEILDRMEAESPCEEATRLVEKVRSLLGEGAVDEALGALSGPICEEEDGAADDLVDPEILSQFVSGTREHLERIEELTLQLEKGDREVAREIKGRIHTIKGEAGALGYGEMERVCHDLEDALQDHPRPEELVEAILAVVDWLHGCVDALEHGGGMPEPPSLDGLEESRVHEEGPPSADEEGSGPEEVAGPGPDGESEPASAVAAEPGPSREGLPPLEPEGSGGKEPAGGEGGAHDSKGCLDSLAPAGVEDTEPAQFEWDPDTVEMVGDFVAEATEGLSRVDEILMNVETEGLTSESINEMFRVFHSIKGVAGFLEIDEIQEFAHTTETLLNKARQGELALEGPYLDVMFEATEVMRAIVEDLPVAVEQGRRPRRTGQYHRVLHLLRTAIEKGLECPDEDVPEAEPGERLGEILVKEGVVEEEKVEKALERQQYTDRALGEELVKMGAARPKDVARALRAQKKAEEKAVEKKEDHPSPKGPAQPAKAKIREMVKVDLEKIEQAMALIGELVIVESMVSGSQELQEFASITLKNHINQLSKITRDLQDVSMSMRLVPIKGLFQKMARMVRDLSKKSGKQVRFVSEGEATEIDRKMVEQLSDPLVHMIRNAVDHGIEPPEERAQKGKDPVGTIRLSAYHQGGQIIIEISDDGRGLDREAIRAKAERQGLVSPGQKLSDQEIYNLIFLPGFSTAKRVTEISGRGVGMDVVKRNIEAVRGKILIETEPGQGTTFKIVLPLTTAIIDGMVVRCGSERYIVPTMSIIESLRPSPEMVKKVMGEHEIITVRGEIIPLLRLGELLDVWDYETDPTKALVVVVETYSGRIGLMVDEVLQQQQIVIKNIDRMLSSSRLFSGAAILSDGRVGLILNTEELATHIHR